jgi:parallel beta-helix repeat protein
MINNFFRIAALTALTVSLLWNIPPAAALQTSTNYYVSPSGSDSNPGTDTAPFKTLAKALSILKAGNTLYIRGGTYNAPATGWQFANSGTANQPITITNYPGERVVLTADNSKSGNYIVKCLQVSPAVNYIRILGTDVSPQSFDGVISSKGIIMTGVRLGIAPAIVAYQCDNWEVAGVDFVKVAYGIFQRKVNNGNTSADRWYVHDNRVYEYYRESGMQFNGNGNRIENNEIIKVSNDYSSTYGCQLLNLLGNNNTVRGNKLTRLSTTRCIGIFFEWDLADANLIENNTITGVVNGISLFGGDNNIIRNNQINGTDTAFVVRSWADGTTAYPCNFSDFMPLESDVANPDWGYMYPHNCRSKGNWFENNTVSGFKTFSTVNLPEASNVFVNGSTPTATSVPATPTATNPPPPTATSTPVPALTFTATPAPANTATAAPTGIIATATQVPPTSDIPTITPQASSTPEPPTPGIQPTFTAIPPTLPSGTSVITVVDPDIIFVGETGLVTVSLNGLPAEGISSIEFTCLYAADQVSVGNVQIGQIFGADPVSAYNDSQSGSFIFAVAGSNGNVINTNGVAFTFNLTGLQPGSSSVECKANISRGGSTLESIPSVPDSLTVAIQSVSTPTPLSAPMLTGQVIASKPVTISLFNPDATLAATTITNPDGTFSLNAPAGTFTAVASADGYLSAQGSVTLAEGATTTLGTIVLPAGDIDNNDVIDQYDALTLGMNYNISAALPADLSNDGLTNVVDLEMLAKNYRMSGALVWQQP